MNKEDLRELLHQEYTPENWKKVTEFVFPNVSYLQRPQDIPFTNEKVESFKQIGNVKLNDGKNLAMFEVKVSPNVNIANNRVELRKLVSPLIDQERNHGVLVIYEQGKEDYRFTFTAKSTEFDENTGDFVNRETHAKRFTYVLGKNKSCKTAANRFYELANKKDKADINTVQDAFSVEKLSKQFFKEYKEHYQKFVFYLMESASYRDAIFKGDDKVIRDFVKLLLGRLVFIQFVQKKRWMGVPSSSSGWENGQTDFLYSSYKNFSIKPLFHSQFLEPLFYETLNNPKRPNNVFQITGTKVPYLNGGLFEKGELDTSLVNFPEDFFNDLLEFFDRYNFTINEYDPAEHEVGIDPEMLGHIFENLLEDNKDKGAFYTPKEIVHYMCQECLKEYLKTYLQKHKGLDENEELDNALEAFVKHKEAANVIEYDEHLATALRDVKICDPAIGSGAFPMGLLNEIYHCIYVLYRASPDVVGDIWGMNTWAPDVVKKNIIQNSIYGVDIEKGAVDIARLRFWLSLIIDEPEPHALPNLDYKIVVGNSLVSKLGDDVIDIDWSIKGVIQGELFGNESALARKSLLERISREQKEFFNPECNKKKLAEDIRGLKIDLLIAQFEQMVKAANLEHEPKLGNFADKKKFAKAMEHYLKTLGWKDTIAKLKKLKSKHDEPLNFFDWKLIFPEVLNELINPNTGFDIVIGNPPYVSAPTMVKSNPQLRDAIINSKRFTTLYQKWDLFVPFMELGLQLLKQKGVFSLIVPYPLTNQTYGLKLRELIIDKYNLIEIVDLNGTKIFENATVSNCIPFISNSRTGNSCYISNINEQGKIEKTFIQNYSDLVQDEETLIWNLTAEKRKTTRHSDVNVLGDFCYISKGMVLNADEKTSKGEFSKDDLISEMYDHIHCRKYIEAKDIERYKVKKVRYLEYNTERCPNKLSRPTFRELYDRPKLMFNRLGNLMVYLDENIGFLHSDSMYSAVLWKDLEGVENKSISASVKRYSNLSRKEMVELSTQVDLKFLIAVLNSRYASTLLSNLRAGDYHIYPEHIRNIPIPKTTIDKQKQLVNLVEKILVEKEKGRVTFDLEQQIDNLAYRLYDLTYEEVKVIDPEFGLSEEEYNNIKIE